MKNFYCLGILFVFLLSGCGKKEQPLTFKASGRNGVIASGNEQATRAGMRILKQGGNAADAAVATLLALSVKTIGAFCIGGEVPFMFYDAGSGRVTVLNGQGGAPLDEKAIAWYYSHGIPGSDIKAAADSVICVPNQKVSRLINENTSVLETFQLINEVLAQGVRGIWRLLSQPGLIRIDFADLCAVTRGRHAESALATAEAQGEHRGRVLLERLFAHPLLDGGTVLAEAETVLVSLVGGPDLTLAEVRRVMEQINRQCHDAQLVVGAAVDQGMVERLAITVIAGRQPPELVPSVSMTAASDTAATGEALTVTANNPQFETGFFRKPETPRLPTRFVPPPPELTPEKREEVLNRRGRSAKAKARLQQGTLPLEIVSKGRFDKSEPTIYHGEDLDVPTYVRRGMALN
jgi:hypothetical protein